MSTFFPAVTNDSQQIESISELTRSVFARIDPEVQIWTQLPRESDTWYNRFIEFMTLESHERGILKVCNRQRTKAGLPIRTSLPNDWRLVSTAWRWKERAEAYDAYELERKAREAEKAKIAAKTRHLNILSSYSDKIEQAVDKFDPETDFFRLSEITGALKTIGQEQRAEFDSQPTRRSEVKVTSMADLLRQAENEANNNKSEVIDAEFRPK